MEIPASSSHLGTSITDSSLYKTQESLRSKYESLIRKVNENSHEGELKRNLSELRKLVLLEGLPEESLEERREFSSESPASKCSLRGLIWKIFLQVDSIKADRYISFVKKGRFMKSSGPNSNSIYDKIRNDTFRTFPTCEDYKRRVPENTLLRVLNALMHSCEKDEITYVQGMNAVCAPFLYVMPELDAFYCFEKFSKQHVPRYFVQSIEGANAGVKLVYEVLRIVDPQLFEHLNKKNVKVETYAMSPVLSFSSSTPPLEELLKLWDFFMAFGFHMNILCVVAQIVVLRDELLANERPNPRVFPPLNANLIISIAVQLVRELPAELYEQLISHPFLKKEKKFNTMPKNLKLQQRNTEI